MDGNNYGDGVGIFIGAGIILAILLGIMVLNRLIPELVR